MMERTCFGRSRRYRGREPKAVHGVIRIFAAVMFLLLTLLGADVSAQTDCSETSATGVAEAECQALVDFYNQTKGAYWATNTNWNTAQLINTWYGVVVLNGQVEQLNLGSNQLDGAIPDLSPLTSLEQLDLSRNQLYRSIPDLSPLTSLEQLDLSRNQLDGSIPASLGDLTSLQTLDLRANKLTGSIPASLGNLTSLQTLNLGANKLTGSIPASLGDLTSLQTLNLGGNKLTGSIPDLSPLTSLLLLSLSSNQLDGSIPASLGDLTSLQGLHLYKNKLTGSMPASLGNLTSLRILDFEDNMLTGSMPASLGDLTILKHLNLNKNMLTGSIPASLGDLTGLLILHLEENMLTGSIPASLGDLTSLLILDLEENMLTGSIPASLGDLTNLKALDLSNNMLTGSIPASLGDLTSLQELNFWGNEQLTWDNISNELGEKVDRGALRTLYNTLNGFIEWTNDEKWRSNYPVSSWYGVSTDATGRVSGLNLRNNGLKGELTGALETLGIGSLKNLNISNNRQLTGELPLRLMELPLETLDIRCTGIGTPVTQEFQTWLQGLGNGFTGPGCQGTQPPTSTEPPLGQVMGIMVIEGVEQLSVSWNSVSEADGYKVQWKSGSDQFDSSRQHVVTGGDTTSYTISNLVSDTEYTVRVIATKSGTDDSTPSREVAGTPMAADTTPPPPPQQPLGQVMGIMVIEGVEQLSVSWNSVSEADGYKVQWKSGSDQFDSSRQHVVTGGDTTSYTISNLVSDTEYTVRVIATKSGTDDSTPSREVAGTPMAADTTPPPPPQQPTTTGQGGGGCSIVSNAGTGNTPESIVFNLLLVVFVLVSVVFPEKGSRQSSCVLQEIP